MTRSRVRIRGRNVHRGPPRYVGYNCPLKLQREAKFELKKKNKKRFLIYYRWIRSKNVLKNGRLVHVFGKIVQKLKHVSILLDKRWHVGVHMGLTYESEAVAMGERLSPSRNCVIIIEYV